jgi:hypothetical protein
MTAADPNTVTSIEEAAVWLLTNELTTPGGSPIGLLCQGLSAGQLVTGGLGAISIVGVRVEPHNIPQAAGDEPPLPAITYEVTEDDHRYTLDGESTLARTGMRFEARARFFSDCVALAEAARELLSGYRGQVGSVRIRFTRLTDQDSGYDIPADASDLGTHWKGYEYRFTYNVVSPVFTSE